MVKCTTTLLAILLVMCSIIITTSAASQCFVDNTKTCQSSKNTDVRKVATQADCCSALNNNTVYQAAAFGAWTANDNGPWTGYTCELFKSCTVIDSVDTYDYQSGQLVTRK